MGANTELYNGFIQKETFTVQIGGLEAYSIALVGLKLHNSCYGVHPLMTNFTAYVAIKGVPDLSAQLLSPRTITLEYQAELTDKHNPNLNFSITLPYTTIVPANNAVMNDSYLYKISGQGLFPELYEVNNQIYTGSYKDRLTAVLEKAGISDNCSITLTGEVATASRNNDSLSLQRGTTYWQVIEELMAKAGISCHVDSKGNLVFIDSGRQYKKTTGYFGSSAPATQPNGQHTPRSVGFYGIQLTTSLNPKTVATFAYNPDPTSAPVMYQGHSGNKNLTPQTLEVEATNNDLCNSAAGTIETMLNWQNRVTRASMQTTMPPPLGTSFPVQWGDGLQKTDVHNDTLTVVSYEIVWSNLVNGSPCAQKLAQWTGIPPNHREVNIECIPAEQLPFGKPFNANTQPNIELEAFILDKEGKITGEDADTQEYKIAVGLACENRKNANAAFTAIYAYEARTGNILSATPVPGTRVLVRINAFGVATITGVLRQQNWAKQNTVLLATGSESAVPEAANLVLTAQDITIQGQGNAARVVVSSAISSQTKGSKLEISPEKIGIQSTSGNITVETSKRVEISAGSNINTTGEQFNVTAPTQINATKL